MDSDPQVLKGLILLLEDMNFNVVSASSHHELKKIRVTQTGCPDLFILPFDFNNGNSGTGLANELRAHFNHRIPAILLSHENGLSHTRFVEEGIVVLSDRTKPKDLRRNITAILGNTLAV